MGNELFKKITEATGLPAEYVTQELSKVLTDRGLSSEEITIDSLRVVMADYLREVILHAKDEFEEGVYIEEEIHPSDLGKED